MDADAPALHPRLVDIDTLTLDPKNARLHNARNLGVIGYSLGKYSQTKPVIVNERTGIVVAGNGTITQALALGHTQIVAVFKDMTDAEAAEYALIDNRSAELATWNEEQLAETIGAAPDLDWEAGGWVAEDFDAFDVEWPLTNLTTVGEHEREDAGGQTIGETEEALPKPPENPTTQTGDLWILGDHRLLCGDSFDADARARLLDGEVADMALMDPPFAIYGSSTGIGADIADDKMIKPFFAQLGFVIVGSIREFAHVYVCCDWRSWATVWDGMKGAKLSPKNCIVWDKGGAGLGSNYANTHEFIAYFARLPPPQAMTGGRTGQRTVYKSNIVRFNRAHGDERNHNAAKPPDMLAELIENSSDDGDLVLDLFNGSGSVIIAGERTGRRVRAMEMERAMCDVTVARWQRETGRVAERVSASGELVPHAIEALPTCDRAPGKPRTKARDGDKRQARRRVQTLILNGTLPKPADVVCVDCNAAPGREYDHHLGYDAAHHEDVEALCATCHHVREAERANAKTPAETGVE